MTSRLEQKWWFALPVAALSVVLTQQCMRGAGIASPYNFSQWLLYFLCFVGLQRAFSFAGWLLLLGFAPHSTLLQAARPRGH